jgi:FixJ family two-component response regulator
MARTALIAVIDDEPAVRRALKRLLRSAGFEAHTYAGGADFLQAVQSCRPDCVIVDIQMRPMDGFIVLERASMLGVDVPAILITAYDSADNEQRIEKSRAIGLLRKPFSDAALLEMLQVALRATKDRTDDA